MVLVVGAMGVLERALLTHLEQSPVRSRMRLGSYQQGKCAVPEINGWAPEKVEDDIEKVVEESRSIVNLVPEMAHQLVAMCAKHGTHYFDSSNNIIDVRGNIMKFDLAAKASGATIIQMITSSTTPADLSINYLRKGSSDECRITATTDSHLPSPSVSSVKDVFAQLKSKSRNEFVAASQDDLYLTGQCERLESSVAYEPGSILSYDSKTKTWKTPVQGAHLAVLSANRTISLQKENYSEQTISYRSVVEHGSVFRAAIFVALIIVITVGMLIPFAEILLPAILPLYLRFTTRDAIRTVFCTSSGEQVVFKSLNSPQQTTAVLLSETALFVLNRELPPGCHTPSSIGGDALMKHFRGVETLEFECSD